MFFHPDTVSRLSLFFVHGDVAEHKVACANHQDICDRFNTIIVAILLRQISCLMITCGRNTVGGSSDDTESHVMKELKRECFDVAIF